MIFIMRLRTISKNANNRGYLRYEFCPANFYPCHLRPPQTWFELHVSQELLSTLMDITINSLEVGVQVEAHVFY